jgi:hypothetical protein
MARIFTSCDGPLIEDMHNVWDQVEPLQLVSFSERLRVLLGFVLWLLWGGHAT